MTLWIGTSGWQYDHWSGRFYPDGLAKANWFDRYAEAFETVELNVTFYRQPRPSTFEGWARRAPDGFRFALKASRFLTHIKRLRSPREPVERLLDGARRLGDHLGPVLIQLPPDLECEPGRLEDTLAAFPDDVRVAVEVRHDSWFEAETYAVLRDAGAALVWADRGSRPITPLVRTAPWAYVRLHAGRGRPSSCYGRTALGSWADRLADTWDDGAGDAWVFFNNDGRGCAVRDAARFGRLAVGAGLRPTRTPRTREAPVG